MIKYFQKLRAKKGFTLVELIVVIAIIGVLAAILIPTMLGYVTQSKVTSANSTAASIKNEIDAFLTQLDTVNKGMKKGSVTSKITITVGGSAAGDWTCAVSAPASFNDASNWKETAEAATTKGDAVHNKALAADLKDLFPEIKTAQIIAYLKGGKTFGVLYVNGVAAVPGGITSKITWSDTSSVWPDGAKWANDTAGIAGSGDIIGTAPVIPHDTTDGKPDFSTTAAA
ncbi:MAG TPA: hypothetical protein DDX72_05150 [Ruminococcaceae bacterium]|nr:hypothetical protein [Oscillospiraceae bacterium]